MTNHTVFLLEAGALGSGFKILERREFLFGIVFVLLVFALGLRLGGMGLKRYFNGKKKIPYKRRKSAYPYSRVGARNDDDDIPSGFGGPSSYDAIKNRDNKSIEGEDSDGD